MRIFRHAVGAVKAIRSMRLWAYETFKSHEVLHLVCMATPDDLAANAECVRCERRVICAHLAIVGGEFALEAFSRFDETDRLG